MIKKNHLNFILTLFFISGIVLVLTISAFKYFFRINNITELIYGYLGSFVIFVLGFISICWALRKSLKTFMSVVLGGMVVKFLLLAALTFLVMKYTNLNIHYFIITFALYYLFYQLFEFRFINKNLKKGKKWGVSTSEI